MTYAGGPTWDCLVRNDPYKFKNDRERLYALISRDVRLVAIAVIAACAGTGIPWSGVFIWLKLHH
jgi:hypothetical protein